MPHGDYAAPYLMDGTHVPIPPDGQFTVPVCTTPERFDKIMNALWYYGQQQDNKFDFDHLIDWIDACSRIVDGCVDFAPICRTIGLHDDRLTWFPENPFTPDEDVPDGYPFHPFTVVTGSIYDQIVLQYGLGYKIGDVFTDLTKLPIFTNWFDIISNYANMPSLTVNNLFGRGKVRIQLLNLIQGGRILVVIDDVIDIFHLHTIEVGRDAVSFPPETQVDFWVEVDVEGDGVEHKVAFVWYPLVEPSAIPVSFGGGVRNIELCGFGENNMPDDPCCPETNDLLSTNNNWLEKIYKLLNGGMTARIDFTGETNIPDVGGGDCAPPYFDHDPDDTGELDPAKRALALCVTIQRYIKGVMLGALRDMGAPQFVIDYILATIAQDVPLSLSNLTVSYPLSFAGLAVFFALVSATISFDALVCLMLTGLSGDKNNTSANFKTSIPETPEGLDALLVPLAALLRASNQRVENYKAFNLALNDAFNEDLTGAECPCITYGGCVEFSVIDHLRPETIVTDMGADNWKLENSTLQTNGFYYVSIKSDVPGMAIDIYPPDEVVCAIQAVADYKIYEPDGVTLRAAGTGGFAPQYNVGYVDIGHSTPVDTCYKVVCHGVTP